ncbi:MAG: bifunctional oligoribonuclease/PAP phosphatase NrnA [Fibrobacteres bacterium]|nr:bifunctional oligoribonuclease/PAP phosphatase NrnA [Fibrobacterota bacterium]
MIPETLKKSIVEGRTFIITTHVNPDADGVGSCVAMSRLLQRMGKSFYIVNHAHLPPSFSFLENLAEIYTELPAGSEKADTWLVLDTSRPDRTGRIKASEGRKTVVIDHHADNPRYGDVCWVDGKASATVEMIFELYQAFDMVPDIEAATALYAGMLIDTGGFRFSNTSSKTLNTAAELLKCGVLPHELFRQVFLDKRAQRVKLEGLMYNSLEMHRDGRVCVMSITQDMLKIAGANESDLEGLSNNTLTIKDVQVGILFIENPNNVKVCFRSDGKPNVSEMAAIFDGGGHAAASGCTINEPLPMARKKIFDSIISGI